MTCSRWMRAAIAGAMLFGFAGSAIAADPTPAAIATARKLIDLKGASNMYDPVFVGIILKTKDTLLQTNPMVAKDLDAIRARPGWEAIPAVKHHHVREIPSDDCLQPGPVLISKALPRLEAIVDDWRRSGCA